MKSSGQIEQLVFTGEIDSIRPTAKKIAAPPRIDDALGRYVEFAKTSFPRGMSLEKMRIASMSRMAPATNRLPAFCASSGRN